MQGELLPAGAWGGAPHPSTFPLSQSSKYPIPFVPFGVLCVLCGKSTLAVFAGPLFPRRDGVGDGLQSEADAEEALAGVVGVPAVGTEVGGAEAVNGLGEEGFLFGGGGGGDAAFTKHTQEVEHAVFAL